MADKEDVRANLTQKQIEILDKFQDKIKDILDERKPENKDVYLLRWLRARNFDLAKSEDMIRKSMAWRRKWKVDTILEDWTPPEVLTKYFPGGVTGFDKEGSPVWIMPVGNLHMKSISMAAKKSDIIRYCIYQIETVQKHFREQSNKLGSRVDEVIVIDDLEGFTLKQLFMPGMDVILNFMGMIEANYPESLKTGFVINGPRIFPIIFRLIKPILSEHTKRKIVPIARHWREPILAAIDADQLPVHWGGTVTDLDGDLRCKSRICLGGEVPPEYFLKDFAIANDKKVVHATIHHGEALKVKVNVAKEGHTLNWVFWTKNHDLKFGVTYQADKDSIEQIIPMARIHCHQVPEDGIHECQKAGTYIFTFDNRYSWLHSKYLSYRIEEQNMDGLGSDTESFTSAASECPT